jgi:hypothetical protein
MTCNQDPSGMAQNPDTTSCVCACRHSAAFLANEGDKYWDSRSLAMLELVFQQLFWWDAHLSSCQYIFFTYQSISQSDVKGGSLMCIALANGHSSPVCTTQARGPGRTQGNALSVSLCSTVL